MCCRALLWGFWHRLRLLERLFDEDEFLAPYGVRSLSRVYEKDPFEFTYAGNTESGEPTTFTERVDYVPGESNTQVCYGFWCPSLRCDYCVLGEYDSIYTTHSYGKLLLTASNMMCAIVWVAYRHMFGGNSNWRGPVWFPVNYLLIEALKKYFDFYGPDLKIAVPTGTRVWVILLAHTYARVCVCVCVVACVSLF